MSTDATAATEEATALGIQLAQIGINVPTAAAKAWSDEDREDITAFLADLGSGLTPETPLFLQQYERERIEAGKTKDDPEADLGDIATMLDKKNRQLQKIADANAEVVDTKAEWLALKAEASEAKKAHDEANDRLSYVITRREDPQKEFPFAETSEGEYDADNDPAKDAPISVLGMTGKETEKLETAGFDTVGDLEEEMRTNRDWERDIDGFGEAKVEVLLQKHLEYRQANPMPTIGDEPVKTDGGPTDKDVGMPDGTGVDAVGNGDSVGEAGE